MDLQESVKDKSAYNSINDYEMICRKFLELIVRLKPTKIVSPSQYNYQFYQYGNDFGHKITRPINTDLYIENSDSFKIAFDRFIDFLNDLRHYQEKVVEQPNKEEYIQSKEINKIIYTVQQAIGCIGDSFDNPNQCRKRIGQLFETLVRLIIQTLGLECEPRIINIPIEGYPGYKMTYELDFVFSRNKAIIASETRLLHPSEVVGSIKTTSKDRIDKLFLDKYLLTKLLGRNIPVIAIFLHDVQRATKGSSIFGINSTFKSNHFLGYTVALNRLDGVYYVDPRPEMITDGRLNRHIQDFQQFLIRDLWELSA